MDPDAPEEEEDNDGDDNDIDPEEAELLWYGWVKGIILLIFGM